VEIDLIRGIPITNATGLAVRKILDDGPLALRGPWGPRSPIKTNGQSKPARWSRQRSAIIGPIPPAGQSVRVTIEAAAARDDGPLSQTLIITPPWTGTPLRLTISNAFTQISGHLSRPADGSILPHTGTYTITAQAPYNPAKAGIRGYPKDLGAQIHLIAIETDPPP
jgi:hypothetical protein